MSDPKFYAGAMDDCGFTGYVPAKFLMRDGAYVLNPIPGGSQKAYLYSDPSGNNKTAGSTANQNNYLVVPEVRSEQHVRDYADQVRQMWRTSPLHALLMMNRDFPQNGSQDMQRGPQWGIPKGSVVPAFVSAASDHLGYVTGLADMPIGPSKIGGGIDNGLNSIMERLKPFLGYVRHPSPSCVGASPPPISIDTDGSRFLSKENEANILQGFKAGEAARKRGSPFDDGSRSPFNDYGSGTQPPGGSGQIGDGNGISPFSSALAGIDPDEPEPSAWRPLVNRPIRYLTGYRLYQPEHPWAWPATLYWRKSINN